METILVKPKDKAEEQLVKDLITRMNIEMELLNEARTTETRENDFASDFELNVEEVKTRWPRMKNLQRTRELLYELMRSGYARLQKI
ncbi:hypothetical protein EDD80_109115 [Anseongella ginsenosidimutans]|uniref:Uncharacterized protein n=1 Tax=Anseongella ginsenosidimutans TaxID=496056 RepID=A0A4R3KQ68_9SPHI|nr:hypothetical protein [Anseongella ginsenosidimutans]QEC53664.1 hypothetical protein FRZ59_15860 [Anseongella ginsenosidimutans]TCS86086.1 hypothetical protein EDD80_109115 [Anseongella ginsenosidimutans]